MFKISSLLLNHIFFFTYTHYYHTSLGFEELMSVDLNTKQPSTDQENICSLMAYIIKALSQSSLQSINSYKIYMMTPSKTTVTLRSFILVYDFKKTTS